MANRAGLMLLEFALSLILPGLAGSEVDLDYTGSVLGVFLCFLASLVFGLPEFFDSYSNTYGSLGAVNHFMLGFTLRLAVLVGGE